MQNLSEKNVRVIKIGKEALFEFIYEKFIDEQDCYFDIDSLEVADAFAINFEKGEFIFCIYKSEDTNGNFLTLPEEINLQQFMENIPDTTSTMFQSNRYKEYTKEEMIELSKEKTNSSAVSHLSEP